jgi:hypothetical protein
MFKECVVAEFPRAEIAIDKANGLYFAERIRLHPAFYMREEGEALIADTRNELEKFECMPLHIPERVEFDVKIGKYSAPFLEISTKELVRDSADMEFVVKAIHIVMQKELARIGGEPAW